MKVKFTFESDLSWTTEKIIEVNRYASDKDIEAMFPTVLNVQYDERNCSYESLDGKIFKEQEMLSYTE